MRRWNGWGEESIVYPVKPEGKHFIGNQLGAGTPPRDVSLREVMGQVPPSRLPAHPLVNTDNEVRVFHARGQSLPDWVALRSGRIGAFPDGVAFPSTSADVRDLLRYAREVGAHVIPYGGGTSVVGHINPVAGDAPVLTVDMSRMNRLLRLDSTDSLATFGAGVAGPDLEAQLRAQGYTLGHFPQSFELSTLGGWIAARSSGQQSLHYGRIESLFVAGHVETPSGPLDFWPVPASAAGPDVRQMFLGSEGRIGIITEATVKVSRMPERDHFIGVFFPDFGAGSAAVREIAQSRIGASMLRLSNPLETAANLALAGQKSLLSALERFLAMRGISDQKCLLVLGLTGRRSQVALQQREVLAITRRFGGVSVGKVFGHQWAKSRFRTPYLRNALWELGYAVDTFETATTWNNIPALMNAVERGVRDGLRGMGLEEPVMIFSHLSHVYPHGSSLYTTYLFRLAPDPVETLRRWETLKRIASTAISAHHATISHQHGVGTDHRPYLNAEVGDPGIAALRQMVRSFDPDGIMNPGKLIG